MSTTSPCPRCGEEARLTKIPGSRTMKMLCAQGHLSEPPPAAKSDMDMEQKAARYDYLKSRAVHHMHPSGPRWVLNVVEFGDTFDVAVDTARGVVRD